jgi:RNA polymerase sigma factor (sigma-70 family)
MATNDISDVIQHLRRTVLPEDGAGRTYGQLLEDFVKRREPTAVAALVRRHGPMVWGVCRRVLRRHTDAEDAFQATFLVLVRRAAVVVPREMVANWLHGVAYQTALKAKATAARRNSRERQVRDMPEPNVAAPGRVPALQLLLDQELSRLPDKYRILIVLCDLEGKTRKEAARQLGVPEGTEAGRLARARVLLARRLSRHRLAVSGGALAGVLAQNAAASVPAAVVSATIHAACRIAAGQSAATGVISTHVAALTEGVLKSMLLNKLKVVTALVLAVGIISTSAAGFVYHALAGEQPKLQAEQPVQADPPPQNQNTADKELRRLRVEFDRLRNENETLKRQLRDVQEDRKRVTAEKAGDGKLVIKVYPVADLVDPPEAKGKEAASLMRVVANTIQPESWSEMGGAGSIEYFSGSGSLVIRQSPDSHEQVQTLLDALRKSKIEQAKNRKSPEALP